MKLQYGCGEGNLAQAWGFQVSWEDHMNEGTNLILTNLTGRGGGRECGAHLTVLFRALGAWRSCPQAGDPSEPELETRRGENDHFLYMRNTQRNSSSHRGQESSQILFPFFGFKTHPAPLTHPKLLAKPRHCPRGLREEVQGSFPYDWLMNLIMVIFQGWQPSRFH